MPNLVGIGNSQVPTNAMLGGLAYQDSVGEIVIDKIKAKTSDTAVDIFVYDTRKDSDGGAWRHRTQNTSWYNEGVSHLRGARKEFPAVAVIVVHSLRVTIYDGDDPNLPLWMILPTIANQQNMIAGFNDHDLITVAALNGIIVVGSSPSWNHGNIVKVNFIKDDAVAICHTNDKKWIGGIINRNSDAYWQDITSGNYIVTNHVNDIAMTVLPNAPIDDVTGLPIPTIAVACSGGVSVIKDNGTVVDHTDSANSPSEQITFTQDGKIAHSHEGHTGIRIDSLKSSDFSYGSNKVAKHNSEEFYINYALIASGWSGDAPKLNEGAFNSRGQIVPAQDNILAENSDKGLNLLARDFPSSPNNNRVAYITTSYNTGWMHGDTKGALLSDTNATDITGSELITNGTFAANSNWTFQGAGAGWSISSGKLNYDGTGLLYHKAYQNITGLTVGQTYVLSIDVVSLSSHSISFSFATTSIGASLSAKTVSTTGTHNITYTATQANISVYVQTNYATQTFSVDNFSLRIAEEDRSLNNKGLQVFGTVKRRIVAIGAELVAYSGFSDSNYLQQPYNSELDFGTGDLYIMFWANFKQNDAYDTIMARRAHNGSAYTGNGWYVEMGNNQNIQIKDSASGSARAQIDADSISGVWQHMCFVRKNNVGYGYKNGVLQSNTYAWTENLDNTSAALTIGRGTISGSGDADKTFLALVRIGAGAPSEEQINKIYNDEKCLYHENAKCTLHGTSDDVKALAFDDTNGILHAGTSSGRSEFQGLNRINNTTTAVTTAISVSNEFVAEQ